MSCRRLIERPEATIAKCRTTGAAAGLPSLLLLRPLAQLDLLQRLENNRGRRKEPSFRRPAPRKQHVRPPHHDYAQKFDRYVPVAAARMGRRGFASPPKRRSPLATAGKNNLPLTAALREGREPLLASVVARCPQAFVDLCSVLFTYFEVF